MNTTSQWVMELTPTLFWDTDRTQVDAQQHLKGIVERVVERGTWSDWQLVVTHVSREELKALLPRLRVPPREQAFLKAFLETDDAP